MAGAATGRYCVRWTPRPRTLILNNEIARRLEIPQDAMELVNSLIFSIKKIPIEWEITEGTRKAIVRNAPMLGALFDFAHLLWDISSVDSRHAALRREQNPDLRPGCGAAVAIDSREGIISVTCRPRSPIRSTCSTASGSTWRRASPASGTR